MELLNATKMIAGYTMGMNPEGSELLVVVIKGTFTIPTRGDTPVLADSQVPLIEADIFSGEPGFSAPVYESDFAPFKPRCDVVLNGNAYAPSEKPVKKMQVGLRVGSINKSFNIVGNRRWEKGLLSISSSAPEPFLIMPISYDNAFGGCDNSHEKPAKHNAYTLNPVGVGFHTNFEAKAIENKPLPNTEQTGKTVSDPKGWYLPMSFGPIGRGWADRLKFAGTYDQNWIDNIFPFLPPDFKDDYFQCAPADQQIAYLRGGETVELLNLTPQGRTEFRLPEIDVPVIFFQKKSDHLKTRGLADTLVLEPDKNRFTITWRASLPLKRNMFEVSQVLVGEMSRGWWRARNLGKTYYPSLGELARSKRQAVLEDVE